MTISQPIDPDLTDEVSNLKQKLQEAEDTLDAIRSGAIDAIVVEGPAEQQVFTLKSADHSYRMLIESMNQGALTISKEGTILYSNEQFSNMMGHSLENVVGSKLQSYVSTADQTRLAKILRSNKNSKNRDVTVETKGDPPKSIMISATHLESEDMSAYMCIVVTDMTERKKADDAKDEFISLASHQLRTPATGVKQYLGMLLEGYGGEISEKSKVYIRTAYDSNERQLTIINDILKTAQIDSDMYDLQKTSQNLSELVSKALKEYESIFQMRKQQIYTELDDTVKAVFDPKEMFLVISNILENASKYSPVGKPITAKVYKDTNHAVFEIVDEGVGISPENQEKVFEKFTRVNNTVSDTVNGSGLGLYWVARIIKLHNGIVDVNSTLNNGSSFKVSLPI